MNHEHTKESLIADTSADDQKLLSTHRVTLRCALWEAYFSAKHAPWKSELRSALLLIGVSLKEMKEMEDMESIQQRIKLAGA